MIAVQKRTLRLKYLFPILTLLFTGNALAAVTLKGVVSQDRERGAPVAGVEISAHGANPVTTGNDGQFVLAFPEAKPGQDVRVSVKRAGFAVVNDILLDHRLPGDAAVRPFEIIVCKADQREARVAEFYRLKGNQAIEQTYRSKLAALEAQKQATAKERDRLIKERDQALKQVEEWARQSARKKPDEIGGAHREALRLFLDGQADAALQALSEERLEQEAKKAQEQLNQAVQGWLLKGQLLTTKFDFAGAGRAYAQATKYAPASYDAWFRFAYFSDNQKHFTDARRGYDKALKLARQDSNAPVVASILNNLGILDTDEYRYVEARKAYDETLTIYRELARKNPEVHLPNVAITLNNLGNLNRYEKRISEARQAYNEALTIYRELARTNTEKYRPYVAHSLNNLGVLNWVEKSFTEARQAYNEALTIYRELARQNPESYRPYVALTLNNLGLLHTNENRLAEARKAYEESLTIYRELARKNPEVFLPDVAMSLNYLGALNWREIRFAEARQHFEEALRIYRQFAARAPGRYDRDVAMVERNLAALPK